MTEIKKRYLFLDDLRLPYINPIYSNMNSETLNFSSAYQYSGFMPFKTEKWDIVRNYNEFVKWIEDNGAENLFVAFDHDLADIHYKNQNFVSNDSSVDDDEKTGLDAAKWLCDYCMLNNIKFPNYIVHSWNPIGKKNIEKYIENYKKHVENN